MNLLMNMYMWAVVQFNWKCTTLEIHANLQTITRVEYFPYPHYLELITPFPTFSWLFISANMVGEKWRAIDLCIKIKKYYMVV